MCLRGLDDVFLRDDWEEFLLDQCRAKNVLAIAFGNRLGCGTALGVSWCLAGGRGLCAAFAGTGGLPALEETVMALHVDGSFHGDTRALSDMREWFEEETGQSLPGGKAVVGSLIFAVESGIHVDGIAKDPRLYEPFPPELVGGRRRLCLGTHSGRTSLEICCGLLGLPLDGDRIDAMLDRVRELGAERERPLFPEEIADIVGAAAR
ncbi:MAG: hypothetical protein LBR22_08705 [Desulfovibrio sp.]|nr:hypothetical protein [Desulfovibrio sp.]